MNDKCCICETGKHESWGIGFKYCEEHDVCNTCGINRADLNEHPWGTEYGAFICKPCEIRKRKSRVDGRIEKGFSHEYMQEITCPHCGYEESDSWECGESDDCRECPDCNKLYSFQQNIEVSYCTDKIED